MANAIRRSAITGAFLIAAILGAVGLRPAIGSATHAHITSQQTAACSNASFSGTYGVLQSGWMLAGPDGSSLPSPLPIALVGTQTNDGAGTVTGATVTINAGGTIIPVSGTGTYAVNADCTGTVSLSFANSPTVHDSFTLIDGGKEVKSIGTDPNVVWSGTGKPIPGACSNATLSGSYGFSENGSVLLGRDGSRLLTPLSLSEVGVVTNDGAGNQTAAATTNAGGTVGQESWTATYSISADCTVSAIQTLPNGMTRHLAGVAVDGGSGFFGIGTNAGAVVTISATAQ